MWQFAIVSNAPRCALRCLAWKLDAWLATDKSLQRHRLGAFNDTTILHTCLCRSQPSRRLGPPSLLGSKRGRRRMRTLSVKQNRVGKSILVGKAKLRYYAKGCCLQQCAEANLA